MTMPAASLAVDVVNRVIDEVLTGTTPPHHVDGCFQRVVTEKDWKTLAALAGSSTSIAAKEGIVGAVPNIPFYFGIQATVNTNVVAFITFHIAYSTWDGRMTYVDKLVCVEDTTSNTSSTNGLEVTLYRLLAKVTVSIGCERLTWKAKEIPNWKLNMSPEFLANWVFLTMDRKAMISFLKGRPSDGDDGGGPAAEIVAPGCDSTGRFLHRAMVERAIQQSLNTVLSHGSADGSDRIRLRLAGPDDVDDIARLVMQLAVYEKEPDAVNMTARDYLIDGSSNEPLFFCLLADVIHNDDDYGNGAGTDSSTTATKAATATTCGMGLFFLGYVLEEGRPYLYLEDLFFEKEHRGLGGGKKMMKQIARIALDLGCCQFTWTALDWNTSALNFYGRIGATLQNDVKITRFCTRDNLLAFADDSL